MERFTQGIIRRAGDNKIAGVAAVYWNGQPQTQYEAMPGVQERIAPGAFDQILRNKPDVLAGWEHVAHGGHILARSGAGLDLWNEPDGLHFSVELDPALSYARDLMVLVDKGVIRGASFHADKGFRQWNTDGSSYTIQRFAGLQDIALTAKPAYTGTSVHRSTFVGDDVQALEAERLAWLDTVARLERAKQLHR
jgi:HK97 family phage prohead protease